MVPLSVLHELTFFIYIKYCYIFHIILIHKKLNYLLQIYPLLGIIVLLLFLKYVLVQLFLFYSEYIFFLQVFDLLPFSLQKIKEMFQPPCL